MVSLSCGTDLKCDMAIVQVPMAALTVVVVDDGRFLLQIQF